MADSTLKNRIQDDVKDAMRSKDKDRLGTLRLITAAIKQKEVDERIEMDDAAVISVLEKMVKQRKDSISQYTQAGRDDLAAKEQVELDLIQTYLPEQMPEAEIEAVISKAIADTGASSMKDMGKLMAAVKPLIAGKADMGLVSKIVKAKLLSFFFFFLSTLISVLTVASPKPHSGGRSGSFANKEKYNYNHGRPYSPCIYR